MRIYFSPANTKLKKLQRKTGKKIFSFDLPAGTSCPYAKDCKSKVIKKHNGKLKVIDACNIKFRCYAASIEALYTQVYRKRQKNKRILSLSKREIKEKLLECLPKTAEIIRIHSSGDFASQKYFDAWLEIIKEKPKIIFYAYTKSLPFWIKRIKEIPKNFILTASKGGTCDELIEKHHLRFSEVVHSTIEAKKKKLPIETDESIISNPRRKQTNVALLVHGVQPHVPLYYN